MSTNPTIGMVTCPLCNEPAAVRKDKRGKFYFISAAGRIAPSNDFGQQWFMEHATIWGESGTPPDDAPDWIVDGKSWPDNSTSRHPTKIAPAAKKPEPESAPEIEPEIVSEPETQPERDKGFLDGFFGEG